MEEARKEYINNMKMKSKKASIFDVFFVGAMLFGLAIVILVALYFSDAITTAMLPAFNSSQPAMDAMIAMQSALPTLDYFFLAIFIGFILTMIISGFLIDTHPIFTLIYFLMLILAIVVSVPIANAFEAIISDPIFASVASHLTMTAYIMSKLPLITLILGIIMIIVIYGKSQYTGGGQQVI
jgi:hypothetical protein